MKLFKKKYRPISNREELEINISKIIRILGQTCNPYQAEVMENALRALRDQNDQEFIKISKSVDIWGGSGAVWEVGIEDKDLKKAFHSEILKYTALLKENEISNYGIRSIEKLLERIAMQK